MKRGIKISFILALVLILCAPNIQAEIIWDSGHHVFSGGFEDFVYMYNDASADILGGIIHEFYMYNNTIADITGGEISIVWGQNTSSVNVYAGSDIYLLRPNDSSTANVYDGTLDDLFSLGSSITNIYGSSLNEINATGSSTVNLFVESYQLDPKGGIFGDGLLTGTWLGSGASFSIDLGGAETINHLNFIPEPATLILFGMGGLILRTC